MLEQAILRVLKHWCVVAAIFFVLGLGVGIAIRSIRYWYYKHYRPMAICAECKRGYEVELKGCHDYIRKLEKSMHVYMGLAHVRAVKNVKDYENNSCNKTKL